MKLLVHRSRGTLWAVHSIQHVCNTATNKSPISGLFKISKRSQRDNPFQKRVYCNTPGHLFWSVFLYSAIGVALNIFYCIITKLRFFHFSLTKEKSVVQYGKVSLLCRDFIARISIGGKGICRMY